MARLGPLVGKQGKAGDASWCIGTTLEPTEHAEERRFVTPEERVRFPSGVYFNERSISRDVRTYDVQSVEQEWQRAWERGECHRAPSNPNGEKYFVHDAAPFPNGPLHLGHVRTYVLGDVTARYQRLLGKSVLYHTGFDAFGLPNELAAIEAGTSPQEYTFRCMELMRSQLSAVGISYDWSRVPCTCDPDCYRWTQWLFLEMFDAGLAERRAAPLNWCPRCRTTLARMQVEDDGCWRCGTTVESRCFDQWFILISRYSDRLSRTLDDLAHWSKRAKRMLAGYVGNGTGGDAPDGYRVHDWLVSRQRSWGTPIPIIHCDCCGSVPVPRDQLPVRLPAELDWRGPGALARCEAFVSTLCPVCRAPARRETDTLDCFFDDLWCFLQALVVLRPEPGFTKKNLEGWLPVDCAQSGLDTFVCFHLYRFLGAFLHERGLLSGPEPIRRFVGNDLVLAGGRKMSKHLGNAVSPDRMLQEYGADALRVAILWAGGPQRAIHWQRETIERSAAFLDSTFALFSRYARLRSGMSGFGVTKAASTLRSASVSATHRVAAFIDEYRPNAAIDQLADLGSRIERFASRRASTGRLGTADALVLAQVLRDYVIALAPFAPHLAEECWRLLGEAKLVCQTSWPTKENVSTVPL